MMYMLYRLLVIPTFIISLSAYADTWKVLLYMDSTDNLSDMAIKNITDMIRAQPTDNVELLIQLHAYHQTALRYRVINQSLLFLEEITLGNDCKQNALNAIQWAFTSSTANHTMLIFSDHGWGILDPIWNEDKQEWQADTNCLNNTCTLKRHSYEHKGFMFMSNPRTYLSSNDLVGVLAHLKQNLLYKNLSIIAFDTCMGAMFETAYQVAPYVDYLVGSQSCALTDGFDYQAVVKALNQGPKPEDLAKNMVEAFDAYYTHHDISGVYTHAALNLSCVQKAGESLHRLVEEILQTANSSAVISIAAKDAPRFCLWPMYTDLISFFKGVQQELSPDQKLAMVASFTTLYQDVEQMVLARCAGSTAYETAHGIAMYVPLDGVAASYYPTHFAKTTNWIRLLEKIALLS